MVASFISCDTKTIEVQKSGGVWHMGGDVRKELVLKLLLDQKVT